MTLTATVIKTTIQDGHCQIQVRLVDKNYQKATDRGPYILTLAEGRYELGLS